MSRDITKPISRRRPREIDTPERSLQQHSLGASEGEALDFIRVTR